MPRRLLGLLLALAALAAAAAVAFLSLRHADANAAAGRDLWQRLDRIHQLQEGLAEAEAAQRGYLLGGGPRHLGTYAAGRAAALAALETLQGDPDLAKALRPPVERELFELDRGIRLHDAGKGQAALAGLDAEEAGRAMGEVQALCGEALLRTVESRDRLIQDLRRLSRRTFAAVATAFVLGLAALSATWAGVKASRRARRDLAWHERRFQNLADHAPVGIFEIDAAGNSLYRNGALRTLFGFRSEGPPEPWRPLIHPEDLPALSEALERALRTVTAFEVEYRIRRSDAPPRWVRVQGRPSFGPDGGLRGFLGTVVDIHSEKARMLEAQASREAQHRAFFELAAAGLAWSDLSAGRLIEVNSAFSRMLGYTPEELAGAAILDLTHPEDRATSREAIQHALEGAGGARYEKRYLHKDGSAVWVDLSFAPLRPAKGAALEAAVIAVDITARKEAEAALKALNQNLEANVARRTAELQEANRELEAFSYSVSHDLRAPLRHLDGFAGLLERRLENHDDEKVQHYLHRIGTAARTMGLLIDDLLAFSRMSRQELRAGPVDLDSLIRALSTEYSEAVRWDVGPLGHVQGDGSMLRQAFHNLLSNAVKFSRGRTSPAVSVRREGLRNGRRVYCVQDNGVGFDMTYRDKLFGVFQRLHPESQFEGTGIGLAIVARVVRRHGGEVWAESTPGEGARFYLSLAPSEGEAA